MKKHFVGLFIWCFLCMVALHSSENDYQFKGSHFIASYNGCSHNAICDVAALKKAFLEAASHCGATILDSCDYTFAPNGLTMVVLLSESHASIHTYPEFNACFVDLFTCGDKCSSQAFDIALQAFLQPNNVCKKHIERSEKTCME